MHAPDSRAVFSTVLALTAAVFLALSLRLDPPARTIPLVVSFPAMVLFAIQFHRDIRRPRAGGNQPIVSHAVLEKNTKRELRVLFGVSALCISIYLFGFLVSAPFYTFCYFRGTLKKSLLCTFGWSVGVFGLLFALFDRGLGVPMLHGKVWLWMGV